jgi:hypothetical protein
MLAPLTRFTTDPLEALAEISSGSGVLVGLLLRRSRVLFIASETSFDVLGFEEDRAQLIGWRAGACPYRLDDYDDPANCRDALLDDLRDGNDALMRRAGSPAFPPPLHQLRSTDLAAPYTEAVGCLMRAFVGETGDPRRGLHLLESGRGVWYDEATLSAEDEWIKIVEVRKSERVPDAWEWTCNAEHIASPVVAYVKDGLRIG